MFCHCAFHCLYINILILHESDAIINVLSDFSHKNVTVQSIYFSLLLEVHPSTQPGEKLV